MTQQLTFLQDAGVQLLCSCSNRISRCQVWTAGVCEEVAQEVVQIFGNGSESALD